MPILGTVASQFSGKSFSSYESISTLTPTSGYTTSFTSIPATYKHLQLRIHWMTSSATGSGMYLQFNSDTENNYSRHRLGGEGSTASAAGAVNANIAEVMAAFGFSSVGATTPRVSIIDLVDYSSTTKNKTMKAFVGFDSNSTSSIVGLYSAVWRNTSAITDISINTFQPFATGTSIALYGVKG
jgi:hypothetical protein